MLKKILSIIVLTLLMGPMAVAANHNKDMSSLLPENLSIVFTLLADAHTAHLGYVALVNQHWNCVSRELRKNLSEQSLNDDYKLAADLMESFFANPDLVLSPENFQKFLDRLPEFGLGGSEEFSKFIEENLIQIALLCQEVRFFKFAVDDLLVAQSSKCAGQSSICVEAAKYGRLDCLKYAHEKGCEWGMMTTFWAASGGYLDCLKYAHENGCELHDIACVAAASGGHIECLKYAHEKGCELNWCIPQDAAEEGHLECLKYAHEHGCELDSRVCSNAAKNGHLECLKYAHENGCTWDEDSTRLALLNGHLDCLNYALKNGCPSPLPQ